MNEDLETKAKLRSECSCIDEYIIRRDLSLRPSWIERLLDFIVFIEKHPVASKRIYNVDSSKATCILICILVTAVMSRVFPDADDGVLAFGVMAVALGINFILMGFSLAVMNVVFALKRYNVNSEMLDDVLKPE